MKSIASTVLGIVIAIIGTLASFFWNIKVGTAIAMIGFVWVVFTRVTGFPGIILGAFIITFANAARCLWGTQVSIVFIVLGAIIAFLGVATEGGQR